MSNNIYFWLRKQVVIICIVFSSQHSYDFWRSYHVIGEWDIKSLNKNHFSLKILHFTVKTLFDLIHSSVICSPLFLWASRFFRWSKWYPVNNNISMISIAFLWRKKMFMSDKRKIQCIKLIFCSHVFRSHHVSMKSFNIIWTKCFLVFIISPMNLSIDHFPHFIEVPASIS